jgi:anti-anti-sigma factor
MVVSQDSWIVVPEEFHVVVDPNADPPYVAVSGEIDLATCAPFRDALNEAIEHGAREIVVDFKRVTFMGSVGIRELVRVLPLVDRIELRSPAPIVRRALEASAIGNKLALLD